MNNYKQMNNYNNSTPYNTSCASPFPIREEEARMPAAPCREARTAKVCPPPSCGMADGLQNYPLAMAYVPWQMFCALYEPCEALKRGTIFQELEFDFCGRSCS